MLQHLDSSLLLSTLEVSVCMLCRGPNEVQLAHAGRHGQRAAMPFGSIPCWLHAMPGQLVPWGCVPSLAPLRAPHSLAVRPLHLSRRCLMRALLPHAAAACLQQIAAHHACPACACPSKAPKPCVCHNALQQAKGEIASLTDVAATNAEVMQEELLHHQVWRASACILGAVLCCACNWDRCASLYCLDCVPRCTAQLMRSGWLTAAAIAFTRFCLCLLCT